MKTNLVVLSLSIFFIISCGKENTTTSKQSISAQSQKSLIDSVGYYHNALLAQYINDINAKKINPASFSYSDVRSLMISYAQKSNNSLLRNVNTVDFVNFSNEGITRLHQAVLLKALNADSLTITTCNVYIQLKQNGLIGDSLMNKLIALDKNLKNSPTISIDDAITLINQYKNETTSSSEQQVLYVFSQVLQASNNFWATHSINNLKDAAAKATIVADAAGAIYGLLCGPICSILEGAVFSVIADANYD